MACDAWCVLDYSEGVVVFASLPVYLIFLYTIYSYRKTEFKDNFFKICFSLGCADVLQIVTNFVLIVLPRWGWAFNFYSEVGRAMPTLGLYLWNGIYLVETCAVTLMTANRLTAVMMPFKHKGIWERHITKCLIIQWVVPMVYHFYFFYEVIEYKQWPPPDGDSLVALTLSPMWLLQWTFWSSFAIRQAATTFYIVSYALMFLTLTKQAARVADSSAASNEERKTQNKLALVGFFVSLFEMSMGVYYLLAALFPQQVIRNNLFAHFVRFNLLFAFYTMCNPWIHLFVSNNLRKHFRLTVRKLLGLIPPQAQPMKTNPNSSKKSNKTTKSNNVDTAGHA